MKNPLVVKSKVNSYYSIITGFFEFDPSLLNLDNLSRDFNVWTSRIDKEGLKSFVQHLQSNYYYNYLSICYPSDVNLKSFGTGHLTHLTKKDLFVSGLDFTVKIDDSNVKGHIEFIDLYLFPVGIGMFSVKFTFQNPKELNLSLITGFVNSIKSPETKIEMNAEIISMNDFFEKNILGVLKLQKPLAYYNPKFKTYTIIDFSGNAVSAVEADQVLYDIGTTSEIGTASGDGIFAPSETYFQNLMQNNKISVFNNWSALCLFDSFTRISFNLPDTHKIWELEYFNIYVINLYQKVYLYKINSELSDLTTLSKKTQFLKDSFITFINEYRFNYISYKFLPNLLYEKITSVMEISKEIDQMELKIHRINDLAQKKRSTAISRTLNIIVFLGFFTVMNNFSSWLEKSGVPSEFVYPYFSITAIVLFAILLRVFLYPPLKKIF